MIYSEWTEKFNADTKIVIRHGSLKKSEFIYLLSATHSRMFSLGDRKRTLNCYARIMREKFYTYKWKDTEIV